MFKENIKKFARKALLWNLQVAARPTLHYKDKPTDQTEPPKKILVIRPDHLGDVLMITPALTLLRKALPNAEITVLVGPWGAPSLYNNPTVDRIQRCEFPGFSRQPKENMLSPYMYAVEQSRWLRIQKFDAVINLRYDFWWGGLLGYLADIPIRVGYDFPEAKGFLTHILPLEQSVDNVPFGQTAQHSAALNLNLVHFFLQQYGLNPILNEADSRLRFGLTPHDETYIKWLLSEWDINRHDQLVAIHPGSGATLKLWTIEGFAAVADALSEKYGVKVILTGGENERALIKSIGKLCKVEPLTLDTSEWWGRLGALFARCNLVIGLDSGPLHLAVAVGTPTIHLFGPTDPAIFGPWGDPTRHKIVRTEVDLPCCPCGVLDFERGCSKGGYCLRTIKNSQVLEAAEELLTKQTR